MTTKTESRVEYDIIEAELVRQGYCIFGWASRADGAYEITASGPCGAGVRRVSVRLLRMPSATEPTRISIW